MAQWNLKPERLACMILQTYPYEADEIVLDFLEAATNANDHERTVFWIVVHNLVENMQAELAGEPAPDFRFGAVM
jgi:hypothetical protein